MEQLEAEKMMNASDDDEEEKKKKEKKAKKKALQAQEAKKTIVGVNVAGNIGGGLTYPGLVNFSITTVSCCLQVCHAVIFIHSLIINAPAAGGEPQQEVEMAVVEEV